MERIRLICATRLSREGFFEKAALGRSFSALYSKLPRVQLRLFADNQAGLAEVYNVAIDEARDQGVILVFLHDDLHLIDFFWHERLRQAVDRFDLLGLVGNRRRLSGQPSWCFTDERGSWDLPVNLSGAIGHGDGFPCRIDRYGEAGQECKLLDGVFLAVHSRVLNRHALRFDPRFAFHFYDVDFCRQAEAKGVRMGTVAIPAIHQSGGNFSSDSWRDGLTLYREKWGD